MASCKEETIKVRGRSTRLFRAGDGTPLMFLHDEFCPSWLPLHDKLAAEFEVFVPIHPGFSGSEDHFDQFEVMEDLVIHYLDLCEALGLERPAVAGASFGGWIAAEWAIRYSDRLKTLILIDALGLRLETAPATDVLSLDGPGLRQALFADPNSPLAMETLPDTPKADAIVSTILGRRTLARFAWQFPDDPRLLPLPRAAAGAGSLGRARQLRSDRAWRGFSRRDRELRVHRNSQRWPSAAPRSAGRMRKAHACFFA